MVFLKEDWFVLVYMYNFWNQFDSSQTSILRSLFSQANLAPLLRQYPSGYSIHFPVYYKISLLWLLGVWTILSSIWALQLVQPIVFECFFFWLWLFSSFTFTNVYSTREFFYRSLELSAEQLIPLQCSSNKFQLPWPFWTLISNLGKFYLDFPILLCSLKTSGQQLRTLVEFSSCVPLLSGMMVLCCYPIF